MATNKKPRQMDSRGSEPRFPSKFPSYADVLRAPPPPTHEPIVLPSHGSPKNPSRTKKIDDPAIITNSMITLTLTTPDTAGAEDFVRANLARNRTIDEYGELRRGLVVPPQIYKRRFRYEDEGLWRGPLKPGRTRILRLRQTPTPRTKKIEGSYSVEEELESLDLGPPAIPVGEEIDGEEEEQEEPSCEFAKATPHSFLKLAKRETQAFAPPEQATKQPVEPSESSSSQRCRPM